MTKDKEKKEKKVFFAQRSKCLFFAGLIGAIYAAFIVSYFSYASSEDTAGFIATALVTPHMVLVVLGAIVLLIGSFAKKTWAALTGSIAMCVGAVLFLMYAAFCLPSIVLGFIGYANQKKLNQLALNASGSNIQEEKGRDDY